MYTCKCGKIFDKQQSYAAHKSHCGKPKKQKTISTYKICDNLYKCECGKEFEKSQSLNAHFSQCIIHRNGKPIIDKWKGKNGKNTWIQGLRKETDERVCNMAETLKIGFKTGKIIHGFLGKHHSKETLDILSQKRIHYLENNPHVKWYVVNNGKKDIKVQGKWEKDFAEWLNKQNIKWDRVTIKYDGYHRYTPDFYLIDFDEYVEIKGWLKDRDKEKMKKVIKEHNIKIKILYDVKRQIKNLELDSLPYFNETVL